LDSRRRSRVLEFLANRQIRWVDSDSLHNLKQEEDYSANQPSPFKLSERQVHLASQPNNQTWVFKQSSDKALPRIIYSDSQLSLKRKGGYSVNSKHSVSLQEQVFSDSPPRKLVSPLLSVFNLSRSKQASAHSDNKISLLEPRSKTRLANPNNPRTSLSHNSSQEIVVLETSKSSVALLDLTKE